MNESEAKRRCRWFLEGYVDNQPVVRRVPINQVPFTIGRRPGLNLVLTKNCISRVHAEILESDGKLVLRDYNSRNGTYLNRVKIGGDAPLAPGDILHFGSVEFQVSMELEGTTTLTGADTWVFKGDLPETFHVGGRQFLSMMENRRVTSFFQPLCRLGTRKTFAFETLGRGDMEGAPDMPTELFAIASSLGRSAELSSMFRLSALEAARQIPNDYEIFINIHPDEFRQAKTFIEAMELILCSNPGLKIVVEIPESLILNVTTVSYLREELKLRNIQVAYDDFGAGQARLIELAEAPPDYLKFDRSLIHRLHEAPHHRRQMVEMLVKYSTDLGVQTLAEGIETEEEAQICETIGFHCAQGFYFGRPVPVGELTETKPAKGAGWG